jgi:hypothetical protein
VEVELADKITFLYKMIAKMNKNIFQPFYENSLASQESASLSILVCN